MTRETKFGMALAGSFLLVAGGIMGVKTFLKDPPPATSTPEPKALVQLQQPAQQPEPEKPTVSNPLDTPQKKSNVKNEGGVIIPDLDNEILGQPKRLDDNKLTFRPAREKELPPIELPDLNPNKLPLEIPEIPIREEPKRLPLIRVRADEPPLEEPKQLPKKPKDDDLISLPKDPPPAAKEKNEGKLDLPPLAIPDIDLPPAKEKKSELPPNKLEPELGQPKVSGIIIRPTSEKKDLKKEDDLLPIEVPDIKQKDSKKGDALPPLEDPPLKIEFPKKVQSPPLEDPGLKLNPSKKSDSIQPFEPLTKVEAKRTDDTFDEDMHSLRNGDTYSTISKLHYRSEAYALALQKYNSDNPNQAQYIRIPPVWVLETRYKRDITGGLQQDAASSPAPVEAKRQNPVYEVAANGEFLAEIAQKTLGNEDAWQRIKELNKNINEVKRIPGGTRLILPVEARIPGN